MRSAADICADFGLVDVSSVPRRLLHQRILSLAEFAAAYDTSFNQLSELLAKRTQKLREAEAREVSANAREEKAKIALASISALMTAIFTWESALGTEDEAQAMADLRETICVYKYQVERFT